MANDGQLPQRSPEGLPGDPHRARGLLDRMRAAVERDASKLPDPFDAQNPLHVDAAARILLRRFYERDAAQCFELLVELTEAPVAAAAHDVAREIGLAASADVLHGAMMGALFIETRPQQVDVRRFLAFAAKSLEDIAKRRVAWLASRPIPHIERRPSGSASRAAYPGAPFDSDPPEDPVAIEALVHSSGTSTLAASIDFDRLGFDFTWLVETLFHRLAQDDRVLLRAAEIEGRTAADIAAWREIPMDAVAERLDAARAALTASIQDACERLATRARREGCTLAGRPAESTTAEDVARHLIACDACLKALDGPNLDAQTAQSRALVALGNRPVPVLAGVAGLIEAARARGREELGRFLYELARACLAQNPDIRGVPAWIVDTKPTGVLQEAVDISSRRLATPGLADLGDTQRHLTAADKCLAALVLVEGRSARALLIAAFLEMQRDDWAAARVTLEGIVRSEADGGKSVESARQNLLAVYTTLDDFEMVLSHGEAMLRDGLAVKQVHYCRCLVHARRGDVASFEASASAFTAAPVDEIERQDWAAHVRADADEVAAQLGLSSEYVQRALGLPRLDER